MLMVAMLKVMIVVLIVDVDGSSVEGNDRCVDVDDSDSRCVNTS